MENGLVNPVSLSYSVLSSSVAIKSLLRCVFTNNSSFALIGCFDTDLTNQNKAEKFEFLPKSGSRLSFNGQRGATSLCQLRDYDLSLEPLSKTLDLSIF